MPNTDLNLQLKLQDQASKGIESFTQTLTKTIASVYSLKKAWDTINLGAKIEQQKIAFNALGDTYGFNSQKMIQSMREAADGTINSFDLMRNASRALTLGIQSDALPELLEISRKAARVMGEDAEFMFQSITLGIGRQSKMILDNLGIIIDADKAYKSFAESIGTTVDKLTDTQKKQAFLNEAIKQGKDKFEKIDLSVLTTKESLDKLTTSFKELMNTMAELSANKGVNIWLQGVGFIFDGINNLVKGDSPMVKATNQLRYFSEELRRLMDYSKNDSPFNRSNQEDINRVAQRIKELNKEIVELQKTANNKEADVLIKKTQLAFELAEKEKIDAMLKTQEALYQAEEAMQEMAERTASGMTNSFGNIFFDAMTNNLQSLASYAKSWGNYMLRVLSEVIAKQMVSQMLMSAGSSFGGGIGSFLTTAATSLTGKQTGGYIPETGAYQLHKGETVVPAHESGSGKGTTIVNNFISPPSGVDAGQIAAIITSDIRSRGSILQAIRSNM